MSRNQSSRNFGVGRNAAVPRSDRLFRRFGLIPVALALLSAGCQTEDAADHPAPSAEEVSSYYEYAGGLDVQMSGNVAQIIVAFNPDDYVRGGNLWAKAFPYIFLFSPASRDAFAEHPGLGGVRVISEHPNGDIVAQALLSREALNEITWRRAINIAGRARQEGTQRPNFMQELVRWGEDNTEFEYNTRYIPSR